MSYDFELLFEAVWQPVFDITLFRPVEYHRRLRIKYQDICDGIKYLKIIISDPEETAEVKESAERILECYQQTRRAYEIQATILAG